MKDILEGKEVNMDELEGVAGGYSVGDRVEYLGKTGVITKVEQGGGNGDILTMTLETNNVDPNVIGVPQTVMSTSPALHLI